MNRVQFITRERDIFNKSNQRAYSSQSCRMADCFLHIYFDEYVKITG